MNPNFGFQGRFGPPITRGGRGGMTAGFGRGGVPRYSNLGGFVGGPMNNTNINLNFATSNNMRHLQQQIQMDLNEFDMMDFNRAPVLGGRGRSIPFGRGGPCSNNFNNFGLKKPPLTSIRGRRKQTSKDPGETQTKKVKVEKEQTVLSTDQQSDSSEATTSCKGPQPKEEVLKKDTKESTSKTDTPSAQVSETDNYPYPSRTVEDFLKKQLKLSHPTGWVKESASKRQWTVQEKEGTNGMPNNRDFRFTVTVECLVTEGVAKKKKEAKNKAYYAMAIKFGEVFKLLSPQMGTDRQELKIQIEKLLKPSTPVTPKQSQPLLSSAQKTSSELISPTITLGVHKSETQQLEPSGSKIFPSPDPMQCKVEIPADIKQFSQQQIQSIPGHPVVALGDVLKALKFGAPAFLCVKEERMDKIGIYCKWMFTIRVSTTKGRESKEFFGKATTKKGAKNQAAAAAYFALSGLVPGKKVAVTRDPPEGRKISVIGSAVPLPVPSHYSGYTDSNIYSPPKPAIHINPNFVPKHCEQTLLNPTISHPVLSHIKVKEPPNAATKLLKHTPSITSELKTSSSSVPDEKLISTSPSFKSVKTESSLKDDKDESLDDCLNEFEIFLSRLDDN